MARKKLINSVTRTVTIDMETDFILNKTGINFSEFVREAIKNKYPNELEQAKQAISQMQKIEMDFKQTSIKE